MSRNGYSRLTDSPSYGEYTENNGGDRRKKKKSSHQGGAGSTEPAGSTEQSRLTSQPPQARSSSRVYVNSDGTMADGAEEAIELSSMTQRSHADAKPQRSYKSTGSSRYEDVVTKEIPLDKTDTLQSLSIRFRCSVSKRQAILYIYYS